MESPLWMAVKPTRFLYLFKTLFLRRSLRIHTFFFPITLNSYKNLFRTQKRQIVEFFFGVLFTRNFSPYFRKVFPRFLRSFTKNLPGFSKDLLLEVDGISMRNTKQHTSSRFGCYRKLYQSLFYHFSFPRTLFPRSKIVESL